jgi:hypothetical protein
MSVGVLDFRAWVQAFANRASESKRADTPRESVVAQ